jgi:hypothetical protein
VHGGFFTRTCTLSVCARITSGSAAAPPRCPPSSCSSPRSSSPLLSALAPLAALPPIVQDCAAGPTPLVQALSTACATSSPWRGN